MAIADASQTKSQADYYIDRPIAAPQFERGRTVPRKQLTPTLSSQPMAAATDS